MAGDICQSPSEMRAKLWPDNGPDTLEQICLQAIAKDLRIIATKEPKLKIRSCIDALAEDRSTSVDSGKAEGGEALEGSSVDFVAAQRVASSSVDLVVENNENSGYRYAVPFYIPLSFLSISIIDNIFNAIVSRLLSIFGDNI